MAGIGPAPAENRRRRNEPARGDWTELEIGAVSRLGGLPDGDWSDEAVEAWAAWRADPVSSVYSAADVAFALDTIRLYNQGMSASMAKEVRMRMTDLGLTPEGKRKLRYRVVDVEGDARLPAARRRRSSGRRTRLSVVK